MVALVTAVIVIALVAEVPLLHGFAGVTVSVPLVALEAKLIVFDGVVVVPVNVAPEPV